MVRNCVVCRNVANRNDRRGLHRFPKDPSVREKWLEALGKENINISGDVHTEFRICSDHFCTSDINIKPSGIIYLQKGAVPSLFTVSGSQVSVPIVSTPLKRHKDEQQADPGRTKSLSLSPVSPKRIRVSTDTAASDSTLTASISENGHSSTSTLTASEIIQADNSATDTASEQSMDVVNQGHSSIVKKDNSSESFSTSSEINVSNKHSTKKCRFKKPRYYGDIKSEDMRNPRKAKYAWALSKKTIEEQRKKIKCLTVTRRRLKDKIYNLRSLLTHVKSKFGITETAESIIEASVPTAANHIFKRMLRGPTKQKYCPELRAFALTLSFYSTKAYEYVRETFNKSLPHISTISKWFQSIEGGPGFTKEALNAIKIKVSENSAKNKKTLCNLVMDEMAIMRQVEWTGKKFTGYVDVGANVESDQIPKAKEAIIFMIVALNGHWKIPVGYFFIDGLTGTEKANLILKLLHFLDEAHIIITSLTFDGAPSNLCAAAALGASLHEETLKPYFLHPQKQYKIYIFLDVCHMIKLVRNCLASVKQLEDSQGKLIQWSYFEKLVKIQEEEGLRAGTKLSVRHMEWFREKMKVKLATQTFSNSVADAFRFFKYDLQLSEFKDVDSTILFVKVFNNLFDIFNVQSLYAKQKYRRALSKENSEEIFEYLQFCNKYILGLKLNGQSVLKSRKKTGFLGFVIAIDSMKGLYREHVLETKYLNFILSYKLSQDHLEIFFSIIRSKGGNSNNPTARQFEHIYKRLLIHSEVRGSKYANAIAMDCTSILQCSSLTKTGESNLLQSEEFDKYYKSLQELDFLSSPAWHLTSYCEDVVGYIAGFVVKWLQKCIVCRHCLKILSTDKPLSNLQIRKTFGRLTNASIFTIKLCKTAEKCLRVFLSQHNLGSVKSNIVAILTLLTMRDLSGNIFDEFGDHFYDSDHCLNTIKLLINKYLTIRIHHETKKIKPTNRVRSVLTKAVLFKNQ